MSVTLTPRERITGATARFMAALPEGVQRSLGGRPIVLDGQTLEPEIRLMLRLAKLVEEPPLETLTVEVARENLLREALAVEGKKVSVASVSPLELPGPAGPIGARLYAPHEAERPLPLLVYLHGGGWVRGDLDTHDNTCRFLAREAGVLVLSVDYRRAPEHKFPAPFEDCLAALRFAFDNAGDLGADPARIALGGDSAGGNLTAAVAQAAASADAAPVFCLIIYPATDASEKRRERRSYQLFREGFFLTAEQMDWYWAHYLPDRDAALDPRVSPLLAEDLSRHPPSYIATAGFDLLRDEGEEYAARLREADVPVALRRHRGLVHGFANMTGIGRTGSAAMREAAGALRMGVSVRARVPAR